MAVAYTNNATTTLSATITDSTTSLSVASGAGSKFPSTAGGDHFYITLTNGAGDIEIMKVTSRSTDTFTVVRGQDGTSARAWSSGDKIELRLTKAMLDDLKGERALSSHVHAASDITSGTLDNARVNWASPGTIGSTTPSTGAFTTLTASGNATFDTDTLFVDATNDRVGIGTTSPSDKLQIYSANANADFSGRVDSSTAGHRPSFRFIHTGGSLTTASPTDARLGLVSFLGVNSSGSLSTYAFFDAFLSGAPTAGAENAYLRFQTTSAGTGAERMRIGASGELIVGNGDSASVPNNALVRATDGSGTNVAGATFTIQGGKGTGSGAGGSIVFNTAAAGSSGSSLNSATERMRIDSAGNVGIGLSSPSVPLQIYSSGTAVISVEGDAAANIRASRYSNDASAPQNVLRKYRGTFASPAAIQTGDTLGTYGFTAYGGTNVRTVGQITCTATNYTSDTNISADLRFLTANASTAASERMRITPEGKVLLGTTDTTINAGFSNSVAIAAASASGFYTNTTVSSSTTSGFVAYQTDLATAAASFTLSSLSHFLAAQRTLGAGSAVTNQHGFRVDSSLTGATNNYGFYSDIASASGRWNFYANGTASNYFAGDVGIGTTSPNPNSFNRSLTVSAGTSGTATAGVSVQGSRTADGAHFGSVDFYHQSTRVSAITSARGANGNEGSLVLWTTASGGSLTERARITSDGKVGIGNTAPGVSLEVTGGIRARGGAPGAFNANNNGYTFYGNSGDTDGGMFSSADGQLEFYTNASERVRIDSVGNVGIGQAANASYKLDVLGSVRAISAATQDAVVLSGRAGGTSSRAVTLTPATLSANRTLTLPDETGTVLTSASATILREIDAQTFDSSTTYTIPTGAKLILVQCIGSGCGGGGGARNTGTSNAGGGGGGGGGGFWMEWLPVSSLTSPVTVTIGAGGSGGGGRTGSTGGGNVGNAGGQTRFGTLYFPTSTRGMAGTTSGGGGGGLGWASDRVAVSSTGTSGPGKGGNGSATDGFVNGFSSFRGGGGGGGGGRADSTAYNGGQAGASITTSAGENIGDNANSATPGTGAGGGTAGGTVNGTAGTNSSGGGGGAGNRSAAGGNGGNGANPGGGGGGGGGGSNDQNGGNGGNGGNGQIKIWVYG